MLYGGSAGDHDLGSTLKELGVSVAGGVVTIATHTLAHRFRPTSPSGAMVGQIPTTYTHLASVMEVRMRRTTNVASIGAQHILFQTGTDGAGAGTTTDLAAIEKTDGNWDIYLCGVLVYTYTPTQNVFAHIELIAGTATPNANGHNWDNGDSCLATVLIDKVIVYNAVITAVGQGTPLNGGPSPDNWAIEFGQSAGIGGSAVYEVSHIVMGFTDRYATIGKVSVNEWTLSLGVTPPTGYDDGNITPVAETDAAAVINERPPLNSGSAETTDFYDLVNNGTDLEQVSALSNSLLAAGDVLYALRLLQWSRSYSGTKIFQFKSILHDGTNVAGVTCNAIASPSSYAEEKDSGSLEVLFHLTAPDGAPWTGKANSYLDSMHVGAQVAGLSAADSGGRVDAIIVEAARELSGDAIESLMFSAFGYVTPPNPVLSKTRVVAY